MSTCSANFSAQFTQPHGTKRNARAAQIGLATLRTASLDALSETNGIPVGDAASSGPAVEVMADVRPSPDGSERLAICATNRASSRCVSSRSLGGREEALRPNGPHH
jgi:hypothetical protein